MQTSIYRQWMLYSTRNYIQYPVINHMGKEIKKNTYVSHSVVSDSLQPMDCSPPGSSVHGILQARILEWVAISFSSRSFQPRDQTKVSCIAGRFFTIWATSKTYLYVYINESLCCLYIYISTVQSLSHIWLFVTPWTVACQAPLSMGFSRQEYWSELPFPFPADLSNPGIKPRSPALQTSSKAKHQRPKSGW